MDIKWWGKPLQFSCYIYVQCYFIDIIDSNFMYVSIISFQTLVNFDFKINRVNANASYVENKTIVKLLLL